MNNRLRKQTWSNCKHILYIDWKLYVKNDIEKLSEQAISLREKLLELLEEC